MRTWSLCCELSLLSIPVMIYLFNLETELATWGGGGIGGGGKFWQHASCASAHITFAALGSQVGGGGGVDQKHGVLKYRDILRLHGVAASTPSIYDSMIKSM